jgi:hypothetical protein
VPAILVLSQQRAKFFALHIANESAMALNGKKLCLKVVNQLIDKPQRGFVRDPIDVNLREFTDLESRKNRVLP